MCFTGLYVLHPSIQPSIQGVCLFCPTKSPFPDFARG